MEIEQGDILICTVDKIVGTTVFVDINGTDKKGTIILSEIAAGRIRNLRDYVVPKKTIICKVLRVLEEHIELSLRRVKEKERKATLEEFKAEKSLRSLLKSILGEKTEEAIKKIEEDGEISEFLEESKKDPSRLKKIVGKNEAEKIVEILKKQKGKTAVVKKEIRLSSSGSDGLENLKKILLQKGATSKKPTKKLPLQLNQ
jgi:translation initiation factor 2 alpha subunit (eIF-2alpha)